MSKSKNRYTKIRIDYEEYFFLNLALRKLSCLESAGVSKWEGYQGAKDTFNEAYKIAFDDIKLPYNLEDFF